jgi:sorbitol/mannitol transport system substrate-binding protein
MILTSAHRRRRWPIVVTAAAAVMMTVAACSSSSSSEKSGEATITVAVTANPLMTTIEKLTPAGFEATHPGIKVKFVTYDENTERANVEKDVAAHGGQYDVVMIGPNDIASWAKNDWISDLTADANGDTTYDVNDLLPPIRQALSTNGKLYAVPFYGESSFLMYRKDMFAAAGVTMPANPTWDQVAAIADKLNDPSKGIAGICLRGLTGWGDNLASFDTVVNTFGGQWFDTNWNAHLTDPAFVQAANFYVNLVRKDGEKGAGKLGFAPAPVEKTSSSGWLWSWALAQESASKHKSAAWQFMDWATSKTYISYDASKNGWAAVPPGTRTSTYENADYKASAKDFAALTLQQINSVNVNQPGVSPQPVPGVQYVGIPEFEDFGQKVSAELTAAIDGQESVSEFLQKSQTIAQNAVKQAGYKQ